jgi:crossover junction endodeoxyribonuclease RuvC
MISLGIDPGLTGALTVLDGDGTLVAVHDAPVLTLLTTRGTRQEYDVPGLVGLLTPYAGPQVHVTIEESQAMPGQGVRSMFTIGLGFGLWLGVLTALALPYTRVRPGPWKRALHLGTDKEQSRLRAQQLFPGAELRLKKHHGRAEALLLAWYGQIEQTHSHRQCP